MKCKFGLVLVVIAMILLLFACDAGEKIIELHSGYYIGFINNYQISLGYKVHPDQVGYDVVIKNYYITGYMLDETYIYLRGIHTLEESATTTEIDSGKAVFYVVNAANNKIEGPFNSEKEFCNYLSTNNLPETMSWIPTVG